MAAAHLARRDPAPGEAGPACPDALWCAQDRVVEEFAMNQPIPPTSSPSLLGISASATSAPGPGSMPRAGFTTYAERRIVEMVQGEERASLNTGIGWWALNEEMERFKDNMEFTKLKPKLAGIDPDDVYSQVPYEKGLQFLWRIERQIGRPAFDEFLKKYISTFKFQSIDTETFLEFLRANVPGIENQIDLKLWVEGTGIPPDPMEPVSTIYTKIVLLARDFNAGRMPREDEVADWLGQEWQLYLENLPKAVEASQDAGPMAYPVWPHAYIKMVNFYTLTVYEKGAEVVRMYETLPGSSGFQKGMNLYFKRHDRQAVTYEDFFALLCDANDADLCNFLLWYSQAGMPYVKVTRLIILMLRRFFETVTSNNQPVFMTVLPIKKKVEELVFSDIPKQPIPLLQSYGAPFHLDSDLTNSDLFSYLHMIPINSIMGGWSSICKKTDSQSCSIFPAKENIDSEPKDYGWD
ncbi:hypothetical protein COCNU_04G002660 [Cocos nucifera]|uniref:Peptidase M1 membrane alanine aminopeptidase domain-containing protein n=1 Tax=Cocos nucifera TaxID=13894 RepID=A0A8K0I4T1_COCNU|nr:hypothetical protein COCNU_04G002660 [Cocos nucifera]